MPSRQTLPNKCMPEFTGAHVTERVHVYDAHTRIRTYTSREAASHEATSAETSYSDNCYYRVTGLIRSVKCKGRRSKSYKYPCTIPGPLSGIVFVCLVCVHACPTRCIFQRLAKSPRFVPNLFGTKFATFEANVREAAPAE